MKVSFIVPIYNVSPYIEQCARSLFTQTLESCEFIFVDDCSTDNSNAQLMELITNEFPHLQSRITLIRHASNLGVSETRNTALKIAKGEFVVLIDGDDWVDLDLAEELIIEQLINNADIVSTDYYRTHAEQKEYVSAPFIGGRLGSLHLVASQGFAIENRMWGMLIRRSLLVDHNLTFDPQITMGEDLLLLTQLLYHARTVAHISEALYLYRMDNNSSAMNNICDRHKKSYTIAVEQVSAFLNAHSSNKEFQITLRLLRRNHKKWQIMRSGHTTTPHALILRLYMLILNTIWRLRWQLFA